MQAAEIVKDTTILQNNTVCEHRGGDEIGSLRPVSWTRSAMPLWYRCVAGAMRKTDEGVVKSRYWIITSLAKIARSGLVRCR
jgi:hypothetical protein